MRNPKKIVRFSIVAFWAIMMGLLITKNYFISAPVRLENQYLDKYIESRDEWAGIYLMDKKVGYSHTKIQRIEDGYQITEDVFMDMAIMGVPQKMEMRVNSVADRDLNLSVFSFKLKSGIVSFIVYGNVDGKKLTLTINSGGRKQKKKLVLHDLPVLASSLKYYLLKHGLLSGTKFSRTFFDPLTLSNREVVVEVEGQDEIIIRGEKHKCFKIRESYKGIVLYSWVNEKGETLREESPMGLVLIKETEDQAMKAGWGDRPDIVSATAIKVQRPFSKNALSCLKVRLKNVSLDDFNLHGGRQSLNDNVVEVKLERINAQDSYTVPYGGGDYNILLAPTVFIQSDNDAIKQLLKIIISEEKDAQKIVRRITKWVYRNIEKKPTISIPSALEVLKTKQGDCNEHAVLHAALCRAAGVPTKICAGIVYLNGSFYYHAWVEVYLNKWVSADPTMDQFPADVTHIKFIEGEMENQLLVLKLVGKLDLDILECL